MRLLDPTYIRDTVDYSFGDESGLGVGGYMTSANMGNSAFMDAYKGARHRGQPFMTLFIDNMRLYRRDCYRLTAVEQHNPVWKQIRESKLAQFADQDLLRLCAKLPDMKFLIFTGFEDMPVEEGIWDALPDNVIGVYACNCMVWGDRVHPFPFGIQRLTAGNDARQRVIQEMCDQYIEPQRLMYINFNIGNHPIRPQLANHYIHRHWTTVHNPGIGLVYEEAARTYYTNIKLHKFMLCPSGNADGCECHRDWEALYMRRVPIVQDSPYLREIFRDLPVLFVPNLMEVTEELLIENDYLYQQMQTFDMSRLDIELIYKNILQHEQDKLLQAVS